MRTVFRLAEAIEEFGHPVVRSRVRRGLWQRPERGVLVTHNGPLSDPERHEVRLSLCPRASAFAGLSALELDGLRGFERRETYVVLPDGARRPRRPGLVLHSSTMLKDDDVSPY